MSGPTSLEVLSRRLLAILGRVTGLESTYVTLIDWEQDRQEILFARNTGDLEIPEGLRVIWSDTLCRRALDGGPSYTDDVPRAYPDSDAARELGLRTYVTVPIKGEHGATFGTLCGASGAPVDVTENTLLVMETLSEMIAGELKREGDRRRLAEANARLERANDELRLLADELSRSEERFRQVIDSARDGFVAVDHGGVVTAWNRQAEVIFGWTQAEAVGRPLPELFFPPEQHDVYVEKLQELVGSGVVPDHRQSIELEARRADGSRVDVEMSIWATAGPGDGELNALVRDISRRRRRQEALATSEQVARHERDFLAVVLGSMREGYVYTVDGQIVDVNETLCRWTGFDRDELIGERPPHPFWAHEHITDAAASAADDGDHEVTLVRKDGTTFPAGVVSRPIPTAGGGGQGQITIVNDLTAIKRREDHLLDIASRDGLTGLFNRRAIEQRLPGLRDGDCVVILDLDHFKAVNDTAGHAAGDDTISTFAACIGQTLRESDWAGRLGGEEFIAVLGATDPDGALCVVERLRRAWHAMAPLTTFSAGIAGHVAGADPRATASRADEALYRAKRNGRNRSETAGPVGPLDAPAPVDAAGEPDG